MFCFVIAIFFVDKSKRIRLERSPNEIAWKRVETLDHVSAAHRPVYEDCVLTRVELINMQKPGRDRPLLSRGREGISRRVRVREEPAVFSMLAASPSPPPHTDRAPYEELEIRYECDVSHTFYRHLWLNHARNHKIRGETAPDNPIGTERTEAAPTVSFHSSLFPLLSIPAPNFSLYLIVRHESSSTFEFYLFNQQKPFQLQTKQNSL